MDHRNRQLLPRQSQLRLLEAILEEEVTLEQLLEEAITLEVMKPLQCLHHLHRRHRHKLTRELVPMPQQHQHRQEEDTVEQLEEEHQMELIMMKPRKT